MEALGKQWAIERVSDLIVRLEGIRWPSRSIPAIAAGAVSTQALELLEDGVRKVAGRIRGGAQELRRRLRDGSLHWTQAQQQVVATQLQADALFRTVDLYSDAIVTRTDSQVATLLAGTDELLRDALSRPLPGYQPPLTVCYLDAGGRGGAINRARTSLPGGIVLPVALVRISPESLPARLSSCLHEAGHQLSVDLDLLREAREVVESAAFSVLRDSRLATTWGSWTSELMADCWNVGLSGGAPGVDGLQRLLSLPHPWLFRIIPGDPHPPGYLRNRFALRLAWIWHPHPILDRLATRFRVPLPDSDEAKLVIALDAATENVARELSRHRFQGLSSSTLSLACEVRALSPARALGGVRNLRSVPLMRHRPLLALAVLGFGRLTGVVSPRDYATSAHEWLTQLAERRFRISAGRSRLPAATPARIRDIRHPESDCPCRSSTEVYLHV